MKHYVHFMMLVSLLCLMVTARTACAEGEGREAFQFEFSGRTVSEGVPEPWTLKVKNGDAKVRVIAEEGRKILHVVCSDASFSLQRETEVDVRQFPHLSWSWMAVKIPPDGDLRKGKTNDQALQLLLAFDGKKIISYVWDSNAPEGTVTDESVPWPVSLKIKVVVVKSGKVETGKWVGLERNVYEDYEKLFGEKPGLLKGVRVQSNCQHTGATAEGYFGEIQLLPN